MHKTLIPAVVACALGTSAQTTPPAVNCVRPTSRPPPISASQQTSSGTKFGTLVVAGGSLPDNSPVFDRFLQEAGGNGARIIYVPTNRGQDLNTPAQLDEELRGFLRNSGFGNLSTPVKIMHTWNRAEADSPEFYEVFDSADAVWFRGGLPQWSYDSYFGTETQNALERLLRRGGVIGGSSAGALMQSNLMLRADRRRGNYIVLGDPYIGFAFGDMENIVVDVHNLHRNRAHDMVEVLDIYRDHLGLSVDEGTAFVMRGDVIDVVGSGYVQVFDSTLWQEETEQTLCADFRLSTGTGRVHIPNMGKSHFLMSSRNDRYNVRSRQVVSSDFDVASLMVEE